MLEQCEGSHAVARAVALSRPEVICAYPISPQTHIVEGLGEMVKSGLLAPCEFINVESEFAALSVAIGASAAASNTTGICERADGIGWQCIVTPAGSFSAVSVRSPATLVRVALMSTA